MNICSHERLLALRELPSILPRRRGRRISLATVYRWVGRGVRRGPERVRLRAQRIGGIYFIDPDDLAQFLASTESSPALTSKACITTSAIEQAELRAEAAGL